MNREQRRYLQKQGQVDAEGNAVPTKRDGKPPKPERVAPRQYVSEVGAELGRVTWPTRSEVIKYTIVVVVTLILITGLVAALDFVFAEGLIALLDAGKSSTGTATATTIDPTAVSLPVADGAAGVTATTVEVGASTSVAADAGN